MVSFRITFFTLLIVPKAHNSSLLSRFFLSITIGQNSAWNKIKCFVLGTVKIYNSSDQQKGLQCNLLHCHKSFGGLRFICD